jgi:hypothetical protein
MEEYKGEVSLREIKKKAEKAIESNLKKSKKNMKKLTKKLLNDMKEAGKRSAISALKLKGFSCREVPFGQAVSRKLINDLAYIWLDKNGKISKITTCNPDQAIEVAEITGLSYTSLSEVLQKVKDSGFGKGDYSNLEFKTDYSNCYYESDTPGIKLCYV